MTRDDIIRMAQKCKLIGMRPHLDGIYQDSLERFAALVASAEREECAKVCEDEWVTLAEKEAGQMYAAAIRARGNNMTT